MIVEQFQGNYLKSGSEWLVGGHLDKISRTERHQENMAWLLNTAQNGGNDDEFWPFLEINFLRKTLHAL